MSKRYLAGKGQRTDELEAPVREIVHREGTLPNGMTVTLKYATGPPGQVGVAFDFESAEGVLGFIEAFRPIFRLHGVEVTAKRVGEGVTDARTTAL